MLFNSWEFALFFLVVFALYNILALRAQNVLLLVASYFFYGWWDWRFLSLLLISTVVDYTAARLMEKAPDRRRRLLLIWSVCTNLGILGFFKYFNFFVDSAAGALTAFGLQANLPTLRVILPVGISFYTFQTMGYTIDVYRRRLQPTRDLLTFAVYVSYFPQLVAGPIERAERLLPQLAAPRHITQEKLTSGALLVLVGLTRKVAIADAVAGQVDVAFSAPGSASALILLRAVFLFALQIYGDFAGYTDIARGVSRMLGIELMENFNHPYFATSITAFWRRWHISLSTWLRDYLYIPLGGNRGPRWFVYRNLMITMLLGGLWHGAAWTFVAWGGIHGVALVVDKLRLGRRKPVDPPVVKTWRDSLRAGAGWLVTMVVVGLAWVFFRAPDFGSAFQALAGIFTLRGGPAGTWTLLVAATLLTLFIDAPQALMRDHTCLLRWPWVLRGTTYAGLVLAAVLLRSNDVVPFIYFQF